MPALPALALLVASSLAAAPSLATKRVAVLDFNARWSGECTAKGLTDVQGERCEILRLFADQARGGALAVLRPPAYVVMTRENTAQILKDMGGQCTEGECEVETARLLGASIVVSGEVTLLEGTYIVSLKIHDVATAALFGTGNTEARSKLEAFRNVRAETERMLRAAIGLDGSVAAASAPARAVDSPPPAPAGPEASSSAPREAPFARRWQFEARAGGAAVVNEVTPDAGSAQPQVLPAFDVGVAYWIHPSWGVQAILGAYADGTGSYDWGGGGVPVSMTLNGQRAYLLGVWSPAGSRYFSAAAGVGVSRVRVKLDWDNGVFAEQQRTVPMAALEVRGDFPIGEAWFVGGRLGMSKALGGKFDLVSAVGLQTVTLDGQIDPINLAAAVGYRF